MPTPSRGKCSIGGSQIKAIWRGPKASWRTELVSLNLRKRSSRSLTFELERCFAIVLQRFKLCRACLAIHPKTRLAWDMRWDHSNRRRRCYHSWKVVVVVVPTMTTTKGQLPLDSRWIFMSSSDVQPTLSLSEQNFKKIFQAPTLKIHYTFYCYKSQYVRWLTDTNAVTVS